MNNKPCLCRGANESCIYCYGKGFINQENLEIIRTITTVKELEKEKIEVENYLHKKEEKLYETPLAKCRNTKRKTKSKQNPVPKSAISHSINENKHNGIEILDNSYKDPKKLIEKNKSRKAKVMDQKKKTKQLATNRGKKRKLKSNKKN